MALKMDLNPKPTDGAQSRRTWWATLLVLCGVLGAMLGLSVKTQNVKQQQDRRDRVQGSTWLMTANADLQKRIAQLQIDNAQLVKASAGSDSRKTVTLSEDLAKTQFLAGLTAVKGEGVIVTLNDSAKPFPKDMPLGALGATPPNIIHDFDINQVVNELKAAGAEAISVNDQRLIATSPIRCAGTPIFVNNTLQPPPYVIKAIGNPKLLLASLNISGGIAEQIKGYDPAMFKAEKSPKPLTIPAYSGAIEPKYARPAVPAAGSKQAEAGRKPGV